MDKPQYAILRFAKYKRSEIGRIEAHDERQREICQQPDVDTSRSGLNFHLVKPCRSYRAGGGKRRFLRLDAEQERTVFGW